MAPWSAPWVLILALQTRITEESLGAKDQREKKQVWSEGKVQSRELWSWEVDSECFHLTVRDRAGKGNWKTDE